MCSGVENRDRASVDRREDGCLLGPDRVEDALDVFCPFLPCWNGVTRQTVNNLVNGKSGISADMAIRLDKAFGGSAEMWLRLQMAYDLAQARRHEASIDVKPVSRRKLHEPHP